MATVTYTASIASGYLTNVMRDTDLGPFRCFTAHYSAAAGSGTVSPGFKTIVYVNVQDADSTKYVYATNSAGEMDVHFSGQSSGATGYMFMLGF